MRQQNFVVCESELTNFSAFDVESIVVVNAVFRLSISHSRFLGRTDCVSNVLHRRHISHH